MRFLKAFTINIALIILVILIITWIAASFLSSYTRHGQSLTLPNLKGLPISEAEEVLNEKKLRYLITDTFFVDNMPKLAVVEQNPAPNSKVKEGRIIYLSINSDARATVLMPNLINASLPYAQTVLSTLGLKAGEIIYKPDIAQNAVLDQLWMGNGIQPNTRIPKGATIDLIVGDGSGGALVSIPNLKGLNLLDAQNVLKSSMLNLGSVLYEGGGKDSSKAVVIRQSPEFVEGATIKAGDILDIYLSIP